MSRARAMSWFSVAASLLAAGAVAADAGSKGTSASPVKAVGSAPAAARVSPIASSTASPAASPLPLLQLDRCLGLPRAELRRALEHELSSRSALPGSLIIIAICEDAVSATLRVSRADAAELSAERHIVLGEVASELRPRLLSLIAAELAESLPSPPPPSELAAMTTAAAHQLAAEKPVAPAAEKIEVEAAPSPPSPGVPVGIRLRLGVRPGMRVFKDVDNPVPVLNVELDLPRFAVGFMGGVGSTLSAESGEYLPGSANVFGRNSIGRFLPFFYAGSVRLELHCMLLWESSLCVQGRLEVGRAGVDIAFHAREERPIERYATYALGATALEWRAKLPGVEAGVFVDVGYSEGAKFRDGDSVLSYDGIVTSLGLSVRWPR